MNITTQKKAWSIITEKRFYTNIMILAIPIILQQFLRVSVDTADSIMLGSIDQIHMTAVSQAQQIFFIFYTLCHGFAAGCSVLIAQYWGKQAKEEIKTLFAIGIKSISIFSILVSVFVMFYPNIFMRIYSNDLEIITLGSSYLRIASCMYLPCAISTMLFACCRGIEQVGISFYANAISYPLNILFDYCFIFGKFGLPKMGINGAALGAVIARLIEFLILVGYVFFKEKNIGLKFKDLLRRDKKLSKDYYWISTPIIAHELIWSTGTTAGSAITGQMGTMVVGGYNVANVLNQLVTCVMNGTLHACSVTMGKAIGSGESKKEIKRQANSMLAIGFIGGMVIGILTLAVSIPFISLYHLSTEARTYAKWFVLIFAMIWPFSGMEMTGLIATLRAGGDGKTGFIADIFTMWMITIPLASLGAFVFHWSPIVVIAIIKFNIVLEALVGILRIRSMKWIRDLTSE